MTAGALPTNSFPAPVKEHIIVKQQFALALNRRNQPDDREKALRILSELLKDRGHDSETLGIKGSYPQRHL